MIEQVVEFSGNHPVLVGSFFALASYLLFSEFRGLNQKFKAVTPAGAIQLMNHEDTVILDVRESKELKEDGVINNYKHIPLGSLSGRLGELEKYKNKEIIVYCRSGHRSASACRTLEKQGFEKISNLSGGIMAWRDAQLPVLRK